MNYTVKEKSELISLLELDHIKQSKLLNPQVTDKRFLLLLDTLKKTSFIKIIIKKIK